MSGRLRCKPNNRELRCEAAAGRGSKNGTKWDDALEPGRSSRRYLLACGARVHVDFHANRHLNDLRCFPGHQRTPSSRHGCRINMVRPHRKGRKPASTKHLGVGFSRIGMRAFLPAPSISTRRGLGARETPSATTGIKNTMHNGLPVGCGPRLGPLLTSLAGPSWPIFDRLRSGRVSQSLRDTS